MRKLFSFLTVVAVLSSACATSLNSHIETARFALDSGDFALAVTEADAAYAATPTNEEVVILRSSAYAARAGVNLLDLAENLTDIGSTDTVFADVHATFVASIGSTGLADLRTAITTLTTYIAAVGTAAVVDTTNVYGNLGLFETIESFARPTILAKPTTDATLDVSLITADDRDIILADFLDSDNYFVDNAGYPSDSEILTVIRENYCVLKGLSAAAGFTTAELRDLTLCQLSEAPASEAVFESTVSACADFDAAFTACSGAGDTTQD